MLPHRKKSPRLSGEILIAHARGFIVGNMVAYWTRAAALVVFVVGALAGGAATPASAPMAEPLDAAVSVMRGVIARYSEDHAALLRCYSLGFSERRRERLGRFYAEQ